VNDFQGRLLVRIILAVAGELADHAVHRLDSAGLVHPVGIGRQYLLVEPWESTLECSVSASRLSTRASEVLGGADTFLIPHGVKRLYLDGQKHR
jgi:hypothetical protein